MSQLDTTGGRPQPPGALAPLAAAFASPKLGALVTLAAAAALGAGLILWSLEPEYVPLGEQSSRQEALEIVEALGAAGIDYRLDPGTGLVLVPKTRVAEARLDLAAAGLAERGEIGLEMLAEEPSLGTSHFTETARYRHALETELARTITSMRDVESARVHLALPKRSVFVRDREEASASVMIRPRRGRSLDEGGIDAIASLVASSIPYLVPEQVTVVDQWGRLLSGGDGESALVRERYREARRLEQLYAERIESLLAPMTGPDRVRAVVTAELDFSARERTEESFEPDPAQLRSEQVEEQSDTGAAAGGVPGALSNQPPGEAFVAGEDGTATDQEAAGSSRSASTIRNFELDRSITHLREAPGAIVRLSAAVIVDDRLSLDENGEILRTPLEAAELAEYERLVREAIGFDEARGDSVVVTNRAFQPPEEIEPPPAAPIWQQDWLWTMVRQSLIGLAVLMLVLLVVRPAVKRLGVSALPAPPADDADADADGVKGKDRDGEVVAPALGAPPVVYGDILNMARAMAAEDPKRVAKVVKDWVGGPS